MPRAVPWPGRGTGDRFASMAETVEFASNGNTASGYLVRPESGTGPGVIVVQEWWGLDSGIKTMTDRLGEAGFVALAPDLYHGELAAHDEMDKAGELMQNLPIDRAGRDLSGAVDFLADHEATTGDGIGVMGFCMGGMLSWVLAAQRPDRIKAGVAFYGFPAVEDGPADLSRIEAVMRGHMAENDDFFPPEQARAFEAALKGMGKDVEITVHPGTSHAFMAPHDALGTRDAELAETLWPQVTAFLHEQLG
jgi:carboxymethylenebutenolidase